VSGDNISGMTHFDDSGRPRMVDVSEKAETARTATASGFVRMNEEALALVREGRSKKGDAAAVAELGGVMGAKKTSDLIPLCHPLAISGVKVETVIDEAEGGVRISASVKTTGQTGVEMEALTAVSIAALTLYDMLKSVDRAMVIEDIKLVEKTGGGAGDFRRET
jgi:cyclic pyranopterin phosphate synthase